MSDFNIRADSVDVEQIMTQIRARIREKRGVDYTEQDLRELAAVKLEKFLDPEGVRSDLLAEFKKASSRPPIAPPAPLEPLPEPPPNYVFEADTIYETHRGILRLMRKLMAPILKLFFNPNTLIKAIHTQTRINAAQDLINARTARVEAQLLKRAYDVDRLRTDRELLTYEVLHNLVVELTRAGIEIKNLKMRVESLSSRLDFDERRARALEGVVEYKKDAAPLDKQPAAGSPIEPGEPARPIGAAEAQPAGAGDQNRQASVGPDGQRRRRRRRRGRRGGRRLGVGAEGGAPNAGGSPPSPDTLGIETAADGAGDRQDAAASAFDRDEDDEADGDESAGAASDAGPETGDPDER